ncbi:proline-rich protein 9 [Ctenodactylus gundi]
MSFSDQQCKQPCAPPQFLQKAQEQCEAQADPCQGKGPAQAREICLPQCQEQSPENCPQQGQDPCSPPCQDQCLPQLAEPCQEPAKARCEEPSPQRAQEKCSPPGKGE